MLNIGQSTILELQIPIAPLEEQAKIRMYIAQEELHLSALQVAARRATQLLSERRSALISAAVTGQIDVRGLVNEAAA